MAREYYRNGRYLVTSGMVRARNRSVQLGTVESIDLGRPLFLMALGSAGGLVGLGVLFGDLLYPIEIFTFAVLGIALFGLSWFVGSLRVFSKLTGGKGWTVVGWFSSLRAMRDAIEEALADQSIPIVRLDAGVHVDDAS